MQKFTTKSTTTSIYTTIYSKTFSTLSVDISFLNKYFGMHALRKTLTAEASDLLDVLEN